MQNQNNGNIPKPVWAVGFAHEQTLRDATLAVFSSLILKRLQHNPENNHQTETQQTKKRLKFGDVFLLFVVQLVVAFFLSLSIMMCFDNYKTENMQISHNIPINTTIKLNNQIIKIGNINNTENPQTKITIIKPPIHTNKAPEHPLIQLLKKDKRILTILIVFMCAVIAAPLWEEFLFRGVLITWLIDSTTEHLPKLGYNNTSTKLVSTTLAIILPASLFAIQHAGGKNENSTSILFMLIFVSMLTNFIMLAFGTFYLTIIRKFTLAQIGFQSIKKIDIWIAFIVSIILIPIILLLTFKLREMFPELVIDPVPLFIFAIVLGIIFLITRRLLPCILMHTFLNGISFANLISQ
ncbi:MAG: CPBP family intramembrane metalloprotease [Planctomycetaceae bacterium]|jgi:hypothetical protein|nr:CPBP family intramembrane metalloprotease [Planctomycetaceae bacterium]